MFTIVVWGGGTAAGNRFILYIMHSLLQNISAVLCKLLFSLPTDTSIHSEILHVLVKRTENGRPDSGLDTAREHLL